MSVELVTKVIKELRKREVKSVKSVFWDHQTGNVVVYPKKGKSFSINTREVDKKMLTGKAIADEIVLRVEEKGVKKVKAKVKKTKKSLKEKVKSGRAKRAVKRAAKKQA